MKKKLYDADGNLVDEKGEILKTKEELDVEKTAAEKAAAASVPAVPKEVTEMAKAVKDISDVMKTTSESVSEQKEKQEKMEGVLTDLTESQKTFQTKTETSLVALLDASDPRNTAYDVIQKEIEGIQDKLIEMWGYQDPITRSLYQTHTSWSKAAGWVHDGEPYALSEKVYQLNDLCYIMGMQKSIDSDATPNKRITYEQAVQSLDSFKILTVELNQHPELSKALNTLTTAEGLEWVPTGLSPQLIDDIRLELKIANLFPTVTIPAGVGSFEYPFQGARQSAFLQGQATSDSPDKYPTGTPPTGKITFTAKKFALRFLFSDEMQEDSAVAILPLLEAELVQAIADAQENACANGDTTSTHQDSDVTAANDVRKAWDGLRKSSGGSGGAAAVDISTLTTAALRNIVKAMGRFGVDPSKTAYITSISAFIQMLSLTEVITLDKIGPQATILSGQMASFDGRPVIVSEFMRQDLNATGVYDGTTTTKTSLLLVNRSAYWNGEKPSGLVMETGRNIDEGQSKAVASRRVDFQRVVTPAASGEQTVGLGYNLTS